MGHIWPPLLCDRATTTMDAASDGARQRYPGDETQIAFIVGVSSGFQHLAGNSRLTARPELSVRNLCHSCTDAPTSLLTPRNRYATLDTVYRLASQCNFTPDRGGNT